MKLSQTSLPYLIIVAIVTLIAALAHAENVDNWEERNVPLVGRVSHLEGDLVRHDTEQDDWVTTLQNSPVGTGDRLYSHVDAKVELILPNNTWIRMDSDTEISLTVLDEGLTEFAFASGKVRLYNKSATAEIITTTPLGDILTPAGSQTDIYLYSDGIEIIALENRAYYTHIRSGRRHEIRDTSAALSADTYQVIAIQPEVASEWSRWNREMDALWAMRARTNGDSVTYLPPALHHDAYALDTHGRWERVYYQGAYYRFWRPIHVHVGWTPFSSGVWRVRWHDNVWIPHEPFGYVTHHYGNWIHTAGYWYWAPPVTRVMIHAGLPLFRIGFAWYPGRVAWLHAGLHVGWFPLAPFEPYYSHGHWGRRTHVVSKRGHYRHRRHKYKHRRHAVVIHKDRMYRSRNYRDARIRKASRSAVITKSRTAQVLDGSTFKDQRSRTGENRYVQTPTKRNRQLSRSREARLNRQVKRDVDRTRDRSLAQNKHTRRLKQLKKPAPSRQIEHPRTRRSLVTPPNIRQAKDVRGQRSKKPRQADTVKAQMAKRGPRPPADTRAVTTRKSRRPDYKKPFTGDRVKREAIQNKVTRQQKTRRPQTFRQQVQSGERHQRQSNPAGITRSRPVQNQNQGQNYSSRGYAPQRWQGDRSPGGMGAASGGRHRAMSVR